MGIHLLVVGQHHPGAPKIDPVYGSAKETESFKRAWCPSPRLLVKMARQAAVAGRAMIDTLDLYDHGGAGHLSMGNDVLFRQDGTGRSIARSLRSLLTVDARVRLLGCETARYSEGQLLLGMLREEFGGSIVVYGTITGTGPECFEQGVFKKRLEEQILFSSTEAATRVAPDADKRSDELTSWLASQAP